MQIWELKIKIFTLIHPITTHTHKEIFDKLTLPPSFKNNEFIIYKLKI